MKVIPVGVLTEAKPAVLGPKGASVKRLQTSMANEQQVKHATQLCFRQDFQNKYLKFQEPRKSAFYIAANLRRNLAITN